MEQRCQLVLLPGMGADERLFNPQRREFPWLEVPPWIAPQPRESLADFGERMAQSFAGIGRPLVLGGASLGGMVAYEMARHLRPDALALIGSCKAARGLRPAYRLLTPLARTLPAQTVRLVRRPIQFFVGRLSGCRRDDRRLLAQMVADMDARFIRWACQAILGWRPQPLEGVPVHQIHGRCDLVLPARRSNACQWIARGGHLINLTHPDEVNAFLAHVIESVGCTAPDSRNSEATAAD